MVSRRLGARGGATVQFYIKYGLNLGLRGRATAPLALPLYPPLIGELEECGEQNSQVSENDISYRAKAH